MAFGLGLSMLATGSVLAQTSAPNGKTCVQVEIAGQKPSIYNCLNQELQQDVQGAAPASPSLPLSASAPSNQVGTFNEAGVAEQYGQNFGHSAVPYRPAAPVFNNSLGPAR